MLRRADWRGSRTCNGLGCTGRVVGLCQDGAAKIVVLRIGLQRTIVFRSVGMLREVAAASEQFAAAAAAAAAAREKYI